MIRFVFDTRSPELGKLCPDMDQHLKVDQPASSLVEVFPESPKTMEHLAGTMFELFVKRFSPCLMKFDVLNVIFSASYIFCLVFHFY